MHGIGVTSQTIVCTRALRSWHLANQQDHLLKEIGFHPACSFVILFTPIQLVPIQLVAMPREKRGTVLGSKRPFKWPSLP